VVAVSLVLYFFKVHLSKEAQWSIINLYHCLNQNEIQMRDTRCYWNTPVPHPRLPSCLEKQHSMSRILMQAPRILITIALESLGFFCKRKIIKKRSKTPYLCNSPAELFSPFCLNITK
jgi:hypothetical protein